MFRPFLLLLVALMFAPAACAQSSDYSHYEFYVGYAYERAENNAATFDRNGRARFNGNTVVFDDRRENYNGFHTEFNQNITRHIGIVTSLTGTYNNSGYLDLRSGRTFGASTQRSDSR